LRAAVLGANDGIISTASLIVGVAAAATAEGDVLIAGVAGLVAGAMSMAAGEYVSVSSQADTERADLDRERSELNADAALEHDGLQRSMSRAASTLTWREKSQGSSFSGVEVALHSSRRTKPQGGPHERAAAPPVS